MVLIPKHGVLRPHGNVIVTGGDCPEHQQDTVQCCHCGRHGVFKLGCGKKLGKCLKCNQVTCGTAECEPCIPFERRLELVESGERATV